MTYRLTTTHADGSQTVTDHADHGAAIEAAALALDMGATGAAIVRPQPRGYIARVLRLEPRTLDVTRVASREGAWTRDDAMAWAREEAARLWTATGVIHRPEVEVLR